MYWFSQRLPIFSMGNGCQLEKINHNAYGGNLQYVGMYAHINTYTHKSCLYVFIFLCSSFSACIWSGLM